MLSDDERRTLQRIEAHLAATDPGFAQGFAAEQRVASSSPTGHSDLSWGIAATAVLLTLLTLGLPLALVLCVALAAGELVYRLYAPAAARTPEEEDRR